MKERPFVHVVMTCWNRIPATQKALPALLDITQYPDWAVTVIDDASTDQTYKWLSQEMTRRDDAGKPNFTLIRHSKQMGTNVSSNEGWRMYEGWYVKLDNNALALEPTWLTDLVELATALGPDCTGIVAHNLELGPPAYEIVGNGAASYQDRTDDNVCGKCALIPEWTRQKLGYWNTNIGTLYRGADLLYGLRVRLAGLKSVYVPPNGSIRRLTENEAGETKERKRWRAEQKLASRPGVIALRAEYTAATRPLDDWYSPWS